MDSFSKSTEAIFQYPVQKLAGSMGNPEGQPFLPIIPVIGGEMFLTLIIVYTLSDVKKHLSVAMFKNVIHENSRQLEILLEY